MTDFARVFKPITLRLNYRLISTIRYLQRLFIHKKITPARLACLCLKKLQQLHGYIRYWICLTMSSICFIFSQSRSDRFAERFVSKIWSMLDNGYNLLVTPRKSLLLHSSPKFPRFISPLPSGLPQPPELTMANLILVLKKWRGLHKKFLRQWPCICN